MSNTITLKKSGVSGNAPSSSDLSLGEIALNYADGHLYYKSGASATPAKLNAGDADTLDGSHASAFLLKTGGDIVGNVDIDGEFSIDGTHKATFGQGHYITGRSSSLDIVAFDNSAKLNLVMVGTAGGKSINFITSTSSPSSGATTVGSIDDSGNATFAGGVTLQGGALSISGDGSNAATLTETGAGILTVATVDDFVIDAGGDINIDADGGDIRLKDAGSTFGTFTNNSQDFQIIASTNDKDIQFKGFDNGASITALTLDMSDGGTASFNHNINLPDGGQLNIGANADLYLTHDDNNGYFYNNKGDLFIDQTASDGDIIFKGTDGGSDITALTLDMSAGGNATFAGTVTATSFHGDGSNLTSLPSSTDNTKLPLAGGNMTGAITFSGSGNGYYIGASGGSGETLTNGLRIGSTTTTNNIGLELYHATNPVTLGVGYSGGAALAFIESVHGSYDTNTHLQFMPGGSESWRIGSHGSSGTYSNSFEIKPAAAGNDFYISNNSGTPILYSDTSTSNIGIGTASPAAKLDIVDSQTQSGSGTATIKSTATTTTTSTQSSGMYAIQNYFNLTGTGGSFQNAAHQQVLTTVSSTGTGTNLKNHVSRVHTSGSGEISNVAHYNIHTELGGNGTINKWMGYAVADGTLATFENTGHTITDTYGLYIGDITSGTQTNTPYGVYQASTDMENYFGGNVGIGTTSPSAKLDVRYDSSKDGIFVKDEGGGAVMLFGADGSNNARARFYNGSHSQNIEINSNAGSPTYFNAGNVGIGTTNPSSLLHLEAAASPALQIKDTTNNVTFKAYAQDSNSHLANTSNHDLFIDTNNTPRITVKAGGNVGIGTTSPSQKLHVKGIGIIEDASSTDFGTLQFGTNTTRYIRGNAAELQVGATIQQLHFQKTNGAAQIASSAASGTTAIQLLARTAHTSGNLVEVVNGSGSSAEVVIDYDGKLGIGATSPSTILEVSGSGAGAAGIDLSQGESSSISNRLFFSTGTASQGIAMYNLSGSLVFGTSAQPANTSGDARMYLTSSGELGIGATPQSKLHVTAGDIRIDNNQQYLAETAAGGTIGVAKMDGSDNLLIGDGNLKIDVTGTSPRLTIDSSGNSTVHGDLTVSGGLTVDGTTTTVNSTTVQVDDKNIELGTVSTPSDTTADGGGITLKGATDKTINWVNSTDAWTFSERVAVPAGSAASPALTFSSDTDTGIYRFVSGSDDYLGFSTGGVLRGQFGPAGFSSTANVYTAATSEFRNYSGVWKGTTGLTGNGFQFINSADGTAMTLSSTGAMVVSSSVSTPDLSLTGLSAQSSEATALMINGSNEVGTRELGSNAFTSTSFQTTLSGSNRLNAQFVGDGSVSNTELDYLDGATSNIQNQLNLKAPLASPALTGNPTAPTQASSENSTKIATTAYVKAQGYLTSLGNALLKSGGTITGNVIFNDNKKAIFGTSSDGLEIYHDQSNSYINDTGTGDLFIKGGNDIVFQDAVGNILANMNQSNSVELYYGGSKKFQTTADGISLHGSGYIDLPDNGRARFGASQDLAIWHDGSNSYIRDESGTGDLIVSTNAFRLKSANNSETMMTAFEDGAVNLYHNNVQKLSTFASGISVTGSVNADQLHLGDNDKALFGNSNDFAIYHNSSDNKSVIEETGSGNLSIRGTNIELNNAANNKTYLLATDGGSVQLRHNDSTKIETTSGGVTVTGHLSATTKSFLVDNPKTGGKLQYGVVESNEHGVYVRGKTDQEEIELPEEWEWLVDEDSVTVDLTSIGQMQHLFIIEQNNTKVKVGGLAENGQYNYVIYGTRKDVDPLEVNI